MFDPFDRLGHRKPQPLLSYRERQRLPLEWLACFAPAVQLAEVDNLVPEAVHGMLSSTHPEIANFAALEILMDGLLPQIRQHTPGELPAFTAIMDGIEAFRKNALEYRMAEAFRAAQGFTEKPPGVVPAPTQAQVGDAYRRIAKVVIDHDTTERITANLQIQLMDTPDPLADALAVTLVQIYLIPWALEVLPGTNRAYLMAYGIQLCARRRRRMDRLISLLPAPE